MNSRTMRKKKWFFSCLLLLLVTLSLAICAGEGLLRALRWAGHQALEDRMFQYDPDLLWTLKPEFEGSYSGVLCRIHASGVRCDPARKINENAPSAFRILCLGDSRTFGYGVEEEKSYPFLLERFLQKRLPGVSIVVINGGVPGYSSCQGSIWLRKKGLAFKPHLIIAAFSINDRRAVEDSDHEDGLLTFQQRYEKAKWDRRLGPFFLYRFVKQLLLLSHYSEQSKFSILDWHLRVPEVHYEDNLIQISELTRKYSIPLIFIAMNDFNPNMEKIRHAVLRLEKGMPAEALQLLETIPTDHDFFTPMVHYYREEASKKIGRPVSSPFRRYLLHDPIEGGPALRADVLYNRRLEEVAGVYEIPVLDAGELLDTNPSFYSDFCHFTEEGNRRLAEALARKIFLLNLHGKKVWHSALFQAEKTF